jgi:hypothetical protein
MAMVTVNHVNRYQVARRQNASERQAKHMSSSIGHEVLFDKGSKY